MPHTCREGKGTALAASAAGVGGHAVLHPYAAASPACACGNAIALAVSCRRWVGASH